MVENNNSMPRGRMWSAGNSVNDMPVPQWLPSEFTPLVLYYRPGMNNTFQTLAMVYGPLSVNFSATCEIWQWTPLNSNGEADKPYLIFSCDTTRTRLIPPNPKVALRHAAVERASDGIGFEPGGPVIFEGFEALYNPPYIEDIRVSMGFSDPSVGALIKARNPEGDHARGDVSTSTSHSFGMGFFGTDITANVDASWSISNSMSLTDYRISSQSDIATSRHKISLAMLDGGVKYGQGVKKPWGPWVSTKSHKTPPMAVQDMELNVSGLWQLPMQGEKKAIDFVITVEVDIVLVCTAGQAFQAYPKGTGQGKSDQAAVNKLTGVFSRVISVPISGIEQRSGVNDND